MQVYTKKELKLSCNGSTIKLDGKIDLQGNQVAIN